MKATYVQRGETVDYTNSTKEKIENGTVVSLSTRIAVVGDDIQPESKGILHVVGVFELKKADSEKITQGAEVYYDATHDTITATADSNIPAGYAVKEAAANDKTVSVKLLG